MPRIDARSKTVRELLENQKYGIDEFQREYRWDQRNIQELLEDFETRFQGSYRPDHPRTQVRQYDSYFLGSMIVNERDGLRYIIDGQQRLTSLTLLLVFLHHLQSRQREVASVDVSRLIFSEQFGERSFNLQIPERLDCLRALFEHNEVAALPEPSDESVRNMAERYEDIQTEFPESLRDVVLPYFIDWLLDRVEMVLITAPSDEDAYAIFKTMNDRGKPLSAADMMKGYLLSQIADSSAREAAIRDDAVIDAERQYIDTNKLDLIGRMEGGWYTRTTERFEMPNIPFEQWSRSSLDVLRLSLVRLC